MRHPSEKIKISAQTKSFFVLFCAAFLGTYITFVINKGAIAKLPKNPKEESIHYFQNQTKVLRQDFPAAQTTQNQIDTGSWKNFSLPQYGLNFKMPPLWKILPPKTKASFKVFEMDPGAKFYNMQIYVSQKGFFAMDGLPVKKEAIGNVEALNVNDLLFGLQKNGYYFTFDIGTSLKLKDEFNAIVRTASFEE